MVGLKAVDGTLAHLGDTIAGEWIRGAEDASASIGPPSSISTAHPSHTLSVHFRPRDAASACLVRSSEGSPALGLVAPSPGNAATLLRLLDVVALPALGGPAEAALRVLRDELAVLLAQESGERSRDGREGGGEPAGAENVARTEGDGDGDGEHSSGAGAPPVSADGSHEPVAALSAVPDAAKLALDVARALAAAVPRAPLPEIAAALEEALEAAAVAWLIGGAGSEAARGASSAATAAHVAAATALSAGARANPEAATAAAVATGRAAEAGGGWGWLLAREAGTGSGGISQAVGGWDRMCEGSGEAGGRGRGASGDGGERASAASEEGSERPADQPGEEARSVGWEARCAVSGARDAAPPAMGTQAAPSLSLPTLSARPALPPTPPWSGEGQAGPAALARALGRCRAARARSRRMLGRQARKMRVALERGDGDEAAGKGGRKEAAASGDALGFEDTPGRARPSARRTRDIEGAPRRERASLPPDEVDFAAEKVVDDVSRADAALEASLEHGCGAPGLPGAAGRLAALWGCVAAAVHGLAAARTGAGEEAWGRSEAARRAEHAGRELRARARLLEAAAIASWRAGTAAAARGALAADVSQGGRSPATGGPPRALASAAREAAALERVLARGALGGREVTRSPAGGTEAGAGAPASGEGGRVAPTDRPGEGERGRPSPPPPAWHSSALLSSAMARARASATLLGSLRVAREEAEVPDGAEAAFEPAVAALRAGLAREAGGSLRWGSAGLDPWVAARTAELAAFAEAAAAAADGCAAARAALASLRSRPSLWYQSREGRVGGESDGSDAARGGEGGEGGSEGRRESGRGARRAPSRGRPAGPLWPAEAMEATARTAVRASRAAVAAVAAVADAAEEIAAAAAAAAPCDLEPPELGRSRARHFGRWELRVLLGLAVWAGEGLQQLTAAVRGDGGGDGAGFGHEGARGGWGGDASTARGARPSDALGVAAPCPPPPAILRARLALPERREPGEPEGPAAARDDARRRAGGEAGTPASTPGRPTGLSGLPSPPAPCEPGLAGVLPLLAPPRGPAPPAEDPGRGLTQPRLLPPPRRLETAVLAARDGLLAAASAPSRWYPGTCAPSSTSFAADLARVPGVDAAERELRRALAGSLAQLATFAACWQAEGRSQVEQAERVASAPDPPAAEVEAALTGLAKAVGTLRQSREEERVAFVLISLADARDSLLLRAVAAGERLLAKVEGGGGGRERAAGDPATDAGGGGDRVRPAGSWEREPGRLEDAGEALF